MTPEGEFSLYWGGNLVVKKLFSLYTIQLGIFLWTPNLDEFLGGEDQSMYSVLYALCLEIVDVDSTDHYLHNVLTVVPTPGSGLCSSKEGVTHIHVLLYFLLFPCLRRNTDIQCMPLCLKVTLLSGLWYL